MASDPAYVDKDGNCPSCGLRWLDGRKTCAHRISPGEGKWVVEPYTGTGIADETPEELLKRTFGDTDPTNTSIIEEAPAPPPPPTVRRYPVAVYFIAYVAETGKGRKFGNQIIKSPKQLSTTQEMRTIETIISNALPATHGIVGNKPIVTIQCITNLGTMLVEETTTEEGAKAEEAGDGPTDPIIADQPS